MLAFFRKVALAEGVSTLALFLLAMPLKYAFDYPGLIRPVGWAHGILFIVYMIAMIPALWGKGAGFSGWTRTILAAFVPFGTFANARFLARLGRRHIGQS